MLNDDDAVDVDDYLKYLYPFIKWWFCCCDRDDDDFIVDTGCCYNGLM